MKCSEQIHLAVQAIVPRVVHRDQVIAKETGGALHILLAIDAAEGGSLATAFVHHMMEVS